MQSDHATEPDVHRAGLVGVDGEEEIRGVGDGLAEHAAQLCSGVDEEGRRVALPALAEGESAIKGPSPLNVLKDAYEHSCYRARSDEYQHLMTDSPMASQLPQGIIHRVDAKFES